MKKVLALAVLLALALPAHGRAVEILEQVLVKVNGDILTKTDLEQRQIAALRARMNADVDAEDLRNDEQLRRMLAEITPQLLVDAVDEMLLVQLGRERGYRLGDSQFREIVENIRKEQGLQDEAVFQAALKQEGMTLEDLRRSIERQMLISRVQQDEVGAKLSITEEEARQYYLLHQKEFAEPATVTLREIFVEVPTGTQQGQAGVNVAQDDAAAEQVRAARARVAAGEDFAAVAAEVSTAPSRANGGLIGPFHVADLSADLQKMLASMKPGDVTEPLRTGRGYQILKLETSTPSSIPPFERVRDVVAERVYAERQRIEVRRFLTRLRGQAIIDWKNEELRQAYEQRLAVVMASAGN